jgi:hypothetical protein
MFRKLTFSLVLLIVGSSIGLGQDAEKLGQSLGSILHMFFSVKK